MKVKLGKQASAFYDPSTGLSLTPGQEVEITDDAPEISQDIRIALSNKHLIEVGSEDDVEDDGDEEIDEKEYEEHKKSQMGEDDEDGDDDYIIEDDDDEFDPENPQDYTVAKIRAYLIDTYDWDEDELKEINSAKKAWLVDKVRELE